MGKGGMGRGGVGRGGMGRGGERSQLLVDGSILHYRKEAKMAQTHPWKLACRVFALHGGYKAPRGQAKTKAVSPTRSPNGPNPSMEAGLVSVWWLQGQVMTKATSPLEAQALGLAQGPAGTLCVTGWPDFKQQRNKSQPVTGRTAKSHCGLEQALRV